VTDRHRNRETKRHRDTEIERQRGQRDRETERQRDRKTERLSKQPILPGSIDVDSVASVVGDVGVTDGHDGVRLGEVDCCNKIGRLF